MADLEARVRWAEREDKNQDSWEFYLEYYKEVTRAHLYILDAPLWYKLKKDGYLQRVPTVKGRSVPWRPWSQINLLTYLNEHFRDVPRGKLQKLDPAFYQKLRQAGLLRHVPTVYNVKKNPYVSVA